VGDCTSLSLDLSEEVFQYVFGEDALKVIQEHEVKLTGRILRPSTSPRPVYKVPETKHR
jgi:hypothetical protein